MNNPQEKFIREEIPDPDIMGFLHNEFGVEPRYFNTCSGGTYVVTINNLTFSFYVKSGKKQDQFYSNISSTFKRRSKMATNVTRTFSATVTNAIKVAADLLQEERDTLDEDLKILHG